MKILSVDPSLNAFGWAKINSTKLLSVGCIETNSKKSDTERLVYMVESLLSIISKWKPDLIVAEEPIGSRNNRAAMALSYVRGIVVTLATVKKIQLISVRPDQMKKSLTKDRFAEKELVMAKVKKRFRNFDTLTEDFTKSQKLAASDAAGVYIWYADTYLKK